MSCETIDYETDRKSLENPVVENGIVCFQSMEGFRETMKFLHNCSDEEILKWQKSIGFNYSLLDYYNSAEEFDSDSAIIPDMVFAAVVNADGFFSIGDSLHLITYEKEYVFNKEDYFAADGNIKSLTEFSIIRDDISINSPDKSKKIVGLGWFDEFYYITDYQRQKSSIWNVSYLAYASVGIRVKYEQEVGFLWSTRWDNQNINYGSVSGTVCYRTNWDPADTELTLSGSNTGTDKTDIQKTIVYYVGTGFIIYPWYVNGTFHIEVNEPEGYYNETHSYNWD